MRVLLVTSRFPLPPWRGNQVRTLEWVDALAAGRIGVVAPVSERSGHLAALRARGADVYGYESGAARRGVGLVRAGLSGRPLQEGLYDVPAARRALARALDEPWDVVAVQVVRCAWAAPLAAARGVPVLFDAIDSMALHFGRAAERAGALTGTAFALEARRCRRREAALVATAAVTAAVARRDLAALAPPAGRGRLVPVSAAPRAVATPGAEPRIVLTGNLGYRPTVRGAIAFAREVWPALRRRRPDLRWDLAGARPAAAVRRLARLDGVAVHPDPPDLAPYLDGAAVALAPMAEGSGVPLKVLEAWAAGVPVVADPWAASGLEATPGEHLLVAADPAAWVEAVGGLLEDPARARRLAEAGRARWAEVYAPDAVAAAIRRAVAAAAG